ncbi:MAG TPA: hypothetical protein VEK76_07575 [Candidatus Binatia bacterium]|nr:hypothetical protein [Candidatus Binatia bacterium]
MTKAIRWRVLVLQTGLVLILGFVAGFAFWAGSFTHSQVTSQLAAQEITFPTADNAAITALPAADAAAMRQYAGETMTTGDQAEVYADHFIKVHLGEMGMTYSQASAAARANPTSTKAAALETTIFQGTTLRSMLLNAYGWWTLGTYATYAGAGLAVAAFVVLLALGFELGRWAVVARAAKPAFAEAPAEAPAPAFGHTSPGYGVSQFTRHDS